jgi:hypothetical protein
MSGSFIIFLVVEDRPVLEIEGIHKSNITPQVTTTRKSHYNK